jgi:hypothetical protein
MKAKLKKEFGPNAAKTILEMQKALNKQKQEQIIKLIKTK